MSDLRTILAEGMTPDHSLSSMYEIEDILLLIGEVNRKIEACVHSVYPREYP